MLRLSELSGFIVRGYHLGKIYGKISVENSKRKPLPIEAMERGDWESGCVCTEYITPKVCR